MRDTIYVLASLAALVPVGIAWEEFWRRVEAKAKRVADCPQHRWYFQSLYDQFRPREFTRHCASCGYQEPWMEDWPPNGATVRTRRGDVTFIAQPSTLGDV